MLRSTFLEDHVDPTNNFPSTGYVFDDSRCSLPRLFYIMLIPCKPSATGVGIGDSGGNRLVHFVRQGGGQLAHRGHPIYVRELRLGLTQSLALILRPLAFGYVDHSTDEFNEIPGWTENGTAHRVDVPDLAAGMNDSVIELEPRFVTRCSLGRFPKFGLIIRMDALKESFESRLSTVRVKTQYAVAFLGPESDLSRSRGPCPTACVAEPLCFGQISFASL